MNNNIRKDRYCINNFWEVVLQYHRTGIVKWNFHKVRDSLTNNYVTIFYILHLFFILFHLVFYMRLFIDINC